jgi:hypothetical protein
MSYRGTMWMSAGIVCLSVWAGLFYGCTQLKLTNRGPGEAIQGLYSHLNCDTQPGAAPWYVEVEGRRFFMGCRNPGDMQRQTPEAVVGQLDGTNAWHRFDTLHEAAMYAAVRLEQCSHYYECSTFIAKDSHGKFAVGPARTDYSGDSVRISANTPEDWDIVATVHTHPCLEHHYPGLFSAPDMIGDIVSRTTGYMVDLCTGDVHEFIPGVNKPDDVKIEDSMWLSAGAIIGHVAAFPNAANADTGI